MLKMFGQVASIVLTSSLITGCGNSEVQKMSRPPWIPRTANWPALQTLVTPAEGRPGLERILTAEDSSGLNHLVNLPKFKEALDEFEKTPIPQEFTTADREVAKTEMVSTMRELQKPKVPQDKANKLIAQFSKAHQKLTEIPNQQRPPGEKFAPAIDLEKIK
jgi:hypothetical protein